MPKPCAKTFPYICSSMSYYCSKLYLHNFKIEFVHFYFILFSFICECSSCMCMHVPQLHSLYQWISEEEVRFPQTGSIVNYGTWCGAKNPILVCARTTNALQISAISEHITYNPIYFTNEWVLFNDRELFRVGTCSFYFTPEWSVMSIKIWVPWLYFTLRKWWNLIQFTFLL